MTNSQPHKHLFLDDASVEQMDGLTRALHQPEKRGPVLKPDRPSDGEMLWGRVPLWIHDEGIYRMFYSCSIPGVGFRMALATSRDGVHWEKPSMGLVEFCGTTDNNHLPVPPLQHVAYDLADPDPGRRYKALLSVPGGRIPAISPDGIHWRQFDVPPIPSSDTSSLCFDPDQSRWIATLKTGGRYGRAAAISTSRDFEHWTEPRFFFGTDDEDQERGREVIRRRLADPGLAKPFFIEPDPALGWRPPEWLANLSGPHAAQARATWQIECYCLPIFQYAGIYIAMPMIYHATGTALPEKNNTDGFHLIQLAMTRDLDKPLTRLGGREPFIGPSRIDEKGLVGNYDRLQLMPTEYPVEHGDELWFFYNGFKRRASQHEFWQDGSPRAPSTLSRRERADWIEDAHNAMHMAVLRKDGFISLDAGADGGYLLTKSMNLEGRELFLNLDAPNGHARVEALDEHARPLAGFAEADAAVVSGDRVRMPVRWKNGCGLDQMAGCRVRFRISLDQARLYALWTE